AAGGTRSATGAVRAAAARRTPRGWPPDWRRRSPRSCGTGPWSSSWNPHVSTSTTTDRTERIRSSRFFFYESSSAAGADEVELAEEAVALVVRPGGEVDVVATETSPAVAEYEAPEAIDVERVTILVGQVPLELRPHVLAGQRQVIDVDETVEVR